MPDVPTIEGYADLVPIGRGGLGDVYRAEQLATGADVAIKVLRDVSDSSIAWHRTRRELNALLALSGHANVVQIVELLDRPHGPALVMEYAPGGSVADLLHDRDGTLTVDETVFVGRQTAAALVSAHARGIVHRDIKPQNLLIDADGQVQLCDFGIAALTRDAEYGSRTNSISMRYASPEDLEHHDPEATDAADGSGEHGDDAVGPASDVYSLGATLLQLARGAPPTLKQRLAPWTPSPTANAHLAALDRVISRCLHPTPSMRPTAQGLLDALDGLALGAGTDRVIALPVTDRTAAPARPEDRRVVRPRSASPSDVDPEADTLTRPSRPGDDVIDRSAPPELPRPVPTGGRWHRPVLLGLAALVAAAATVLLWPSDDAGAPGPQTVPSPSTATAPATFPVTSPITSPASVVAVARPADLVALTDDEVVWNVGAVGDCLVQVAGRDELTVVPCSEAHDLQRYAVGSVADPRADAGADAPFGQEDVARAVTAACSEAFSVFVASPVEASALRIAQTRPNADTWAAGDRGYHCYLGIEGARIIGDARATGW